MIITQLIFLLFIIFFIRYKKKAVLYIIPLSLFFTMLPVVRIGGTYIGLCDAINFVIYGYILGRKDARKAIFCNPLFLPLFGNFILLLLIALYGTERTSLYVLWKTISNEILLPLAFIYFLRTKNDIKLIVNLYLKVFWVLCIYGIIEFLLNYNIILYWLQSQTDLSFWVDHTNDIRYGYGRYNSFFHFPITFGVLINEHIHFLVHDYFKESVMNGLSICWTSSLCLKKEVIKEIPMFRVGIKRGEDLDLWLRIALNYDVAYLNLPKVFYRTGLSDSLTSDYSKNGEFPYYEWLNFTSESSYYRKYVILAMYIHAKNAFIHHDYDTCLAELWSVKTIAWRFKWAKRLLLLVISWIKSK